MGVVYEATHARLAGRYAIKVLLQKLSENPQALIRFDREARITSSLQHPNIVHVLDFNTASDGTEYLVMEYLQGETLAERVVRLGALPVEAVIGIVEQVASALSAAHGHGIVHRDLKPDNVFLVPVEGRQDELVKVLDFGISKARDFSRGLQGPVSALVGTPQYMSPEQCRASNDVDAATDQFALGVITYEMLTGRVPFQGDNLGALLTQVLYADPPPMSLAGAGSDAVEQVVRRGLSKSRKERFPSVTAFADALRAAAGERPSPTIISVTRPSSSPGPMARRITAEYARGRPSGGRRGSPRARRGLGWGTLTIAAAGAGIALFLALTPKPDRAAVLRPAPGASHRPATPLAKPRLVRSASSHAEPATASAGAFPLLAATTLPARPGAGAEFTDPAHTQARELTKASTPSARAISRPHRLSAMNQDQPEAETEPEILNAPRDVIPLRRLPSRSTGRKDSPRAAAAAVSRDDDATLPLTEGVGSEP